MPQNAYLCSPNKPQPMSKSRLKTINNGLVAALVALTLGACNPKQSSTVERIDNLKKQVNADVKDLQQIENEDYPKLSKDFMYCDSLLQYLDSTQVEQAFEKLNLTQAYLRQFDEVKGEMHQKAEYANLQLDRLKADFESQYINDSLATVYLEAETKVADTLHYRVLYFQDRFANCSKEMATIKKACR